MVTLPREYGAGKQQFFIASARPVAGESLRNANNNDSVLELRSLISAVAARPAVRALLSPAEFSGVAKA
jgi:hypothetical protein